MPEDTRCTWGAEKIHGALTLRLLSTLWLQIPKPPFLLEINKQALNTNIVPHTLLD